MTGAGADVRAALSTIAQSEKQLDAAQAQVFAAQANNTKAQLDLQRYTPLVQRDVVSKQQYDAVVATAASEKAQLSQAQANLAGAQRSGEGSQRSAWQRRGQSITPRKTGRGRLRRNGREPMRQRPRCSRQRRRLKPIA